MSDTVTVKVWVGYDDPQPDEKPDYEFEVPVSDNGLSRPFAGESVEKNLYRSMHQFAIDTRDLDEDYELLVNRPDDNVPTDPDAVQPAINGGLQMEAETPAHEQAAGFELWGRCKFWARKAD